MHLISIDLYLFHLISFYFTLFHSVSLGQPDGTYLKSLNSLELIRNHCTLRREKGKAPVQKGKGKSTRVHLRRNSTLQPDRAYARTNETKRLPTWTHPPNLRYKFLKPSRSKFIRDLSSQSNRFSTPYIPDHSSPSVPLEGGDSSKQRNLAKTHIIQGKIQPQCPT